MKTVTKIPALNQRRVEAKQHQADELQEAHEKFSNHEKNESCPPVVLLLAHTRCTVDHLCRSKYAYLRTVTS